MNINFTFNVDVIEYQYYVFNTAFSTDIVYKV